MPPPHRFFLRIGCMMNVRGRAAAVVAASLALAGGLVLFDPAAPQALAFATPPPPVTLPTSIIAATGSGATGGQIATGLTSTGGVGTLATVTVAQAGVAGTAGVVGAGLVIGTTAGTQVAGWVGLPTTGNFLCDTWYLMDSAAGCVTGSLPNYVVNGDVEVTSPGWAGGDNSLAVLVPGGTYTGGDPWVTGQITVDVTSSPAFGAQVGTGTALAALAGELKQVGGYNNPGVNLSVVGYWKNGTGPVVAGSTFSASPVLGSQTAGFPMTSTATKTWGAPTGSYTFDHFEFYSQGGAVDANRLVWYPEGHALWTPGTTADPQRWWRTTWQCSAGSGGSSQSAPFVESDPEWPGFPAASCDAGAVTSVLVEKVTEGGPTTTIVSWSSPTELQQWYDANPGCWDGSCTLDLMRVDPQTGARLSCLSNPAACVDWYSDPSKAENYECQYGGSAVELAECDVYRPTFNVATGAPTTDNDGKPKSASETNPYGDPKAGGNPVPAGDPSGDTDNGPSDDCPPPFTFTAGGIGYWVTKGVQCALEWAFVPPNDSTNLNRIRWAFSTAAPVAFSADVSSVFDGLSVPAASCEGPGFTWELVGVEVRPFNSCDPPMDNVAMWSRRISTVLVGVFGSMAVLRALGSGFGWKPSAGGDA